MSENRSRRCLFGKPDHEQLNIDLENEIKKVDQQNIDSFKKRWGFDPENETPMSSSKFLWEKMPAKTSPELPPGAQRPVKTIPISRTVQQPTRETPKLVPSSSTGESAESSQSGESHDEGPDLNQNFSIGKRKNKLPDSKSDDVIKKCKTTRS